MTGITETILEQTALAWFAKLGYQTLHGPDLAPDLPAATAAAQAGGSSPEREDYRQAILVGRLRQALERINPGVSAEGIDDAMRRILNTPSPDLMTNNRAFHRLLTDGIPVEVAVQASSSPAGRGGGEGFVYGGTEHKIVWLFDLDDVTNNEFLALNQYTVIEECGAARALRRSLAIREKTFGSDHPEVAKSLENLALLLRATNRVREAQVLEQRVAKIRAIR